MPNSTINQLQKVLANSYALMLKKQNYHWNVSGANFYSLHELFGKQYEEQFEAIDEIAERIKALGGFPKGSFSAYQELAEIEDENKEKLSAEKMLKNLVLDEQKMIEILQNALKKTQKEEDEVSADLFIGRLEVHQKNKWMLEASI